MADNGLMDDFEDWIVVDRDGSAWTYERTTPVISGESRLLLRAPAETPTGPLPLVAMYAPGMWQSVRRMTYGDG